MRRGRARLLTCGIALMTAAVAACAPAAQHISQTASNGGRILTTGDAPTLQAAMRQSRDLGTQAPSQVLHFSLTLRGRNVREWQALVSSGGRVSAKAFAQRYGPDPQLVASARALLSTAGLTSSWNAG